MAQASRTQRCLRRYISVPDALLPRTIHNGSSLAARSLTRTHTRRNHSTTPPPPPPPPPHSSTSSSSVSSAEMNHFATLASSWWDPLGPSRILHLMNPLRHDFIASCLGQQQQKEGGSGLRYLDIGCGGGIFAESLARTIPSSSSASSTGTNATSLLAIDPSPVMIEIALSHARKDPALHNHLQTGRFEYRNTSMEELEGSTQADERFDVVTLFEVLEHVDPERSSPRAFLQKCLDLVAPGGWLVGSTIARTLPAYVVNQVIAEAPWPIGVVRRERHEWSKFCVSEELLGRVKGLGGSGGWKMVPGTESWGNYFWGIRKAC
ncbi:hexaprenyldihydroxybenzoate methyltransferase [Nannizzia gypsea CBS 118893]|uniref:Hexaprenyldihydroxybenzoate methyltransferase n=1 Tax=Arthroderma gypseum (strain ATCC MYA-4604 / CBS 118893) TaxID=535722 RepID=E4V1J3_ARTGP|nr:hexaprenyldihydroxybenzoate methyltransferase [Nannizzia gypsea CBS 118893]EFR03908.1 hexaprenyldihydroxybenzoate methyltransferase [Nannizzia gypsea CBS 118893]